MLISSFTNGLLAFGMLPAVLLAAGDPSSYDESPFPFIPIFANTFQSAHAATGASCILIVFILSILVGSMACASRVIWSFSRDRGLPGWKTLSQVSCNTLQRTNEAKQLTGKHTHYETTCSTSYCDYLMRSAWTH